MERITLASGIELDVVDTGPRDAPALIFLHGFPESHTTWRHQIAHLADRYRCVVPDQRGYRGSSKPQDVSAYRVDKLVGDVFQLADALGIETFTVIGHDWGGAIAWAVALFGQTTRVNRAIIINAPHPTRFQELLWADPAQRGASQYMRAFRDTSRDDDVRAHGLLPMLARALPPEAFNIDLPADGRTARLADWANPDAAIGMLNWYRASPIDVPPPDAPYGLIEGRSLRPVSVLTIPTLVVWALDDTALLPANIDGLDAFVADLELVRVPDCGHFVPWQAPAPVNAALDAFLARTAKPRSTT